MIKHKRLIRTVMTTYDTALDLTPASDRSIVSGRLVGAALGLSAAMLFLPSGIPGFPTELDVGSLRLRFFDALLALWLIVYALSTAQRGALPKLAAPGYLLTFCAFAVYAFMVNMFMAGGSAAIRELIQHIEFILFACLVAPVVTDDRQRQGFLMAFLIGIAAIAVANAAIHWMHGYYGSYKLFGVAKVTYGLATFMLILRVILERRPGRLAVLLAALAGIAILMLLSSERKGWVAVIVASSFLFGIIVMQSRGEGAAIRHRLLFGLVIAIPLLAMAFPYLLKIDAFQAQLAKLVAASATRNATELVLYSPDIVYESNLLRSFLLDESWRAFLASPVFGHGTEGLQYFIYHSYPETPYVTGAHNEFVAVGVEYGAIGLLLYVATWGLLLRDAVFFGFLRNSRIGFHDRMFAAGITVYGMVVCMFLAASAATIFYLALPIALGMALRQRLALEPPSARRFAGTA